MLKIACFCFAMAAVPLWSQVEPSATGGGFTLDDTRMMTPPPVSGGAYPKNVGAESRSNFVGGGLVVTGAYNDNIMVDPTQKIADVNYSIVPTISIDRMTPREALALSYSSGFTLYQKTTQLNGVTQNGTADYRFHLTKYAVVNVRDTFSQNFNLFNQANPFKPERVAELEKLRQSLDPFQLGKLIDEKLQRIYDMANRRLSPKVTGQETQRGRRNGCGKAARWKSPKPDFSTELGNRAKNARFPLPPGRGDGGSSVTFPMSRRSTPGLHF